MLFQSIYVHDLWAPLAQMLQTFSHATGIKTPSNQHRCWRLCYEQSGVSSVPQGHGSHEFKSNTDWTENILFYSSIKTLGPEGEVDIQQNRG